MHKCKKLIFLFLLFLSSTVFAQDTEMADTSADGPNIFEKVEIDASFMGGPAAWKKFLEKNINAMIPTDNGAPEGKFTVMVRFIVKRDGSLSDVKAITKMGYGTEQEVIRLIKSSGKWNPGYQSGRPVNSYHTQPVTFMVDYDALDIKTETDYVLYANKDNPISINVYKTKPENIKAVISKGTITPSGDGQFIARVPKAGERITITVYNTKKDDKELGVVIFDVKGKD